ncbi:hypothetical protein TYRP_012583 [Tyrophagus putrescentiae]|nr:hypothetical protein TYRP_012583 [Tyrophagus putrescentiae]
MQLSPALVDAWSSPSLWQPSSHRCFSTSQCLDAPQVAALGRFPFHLTKSVDSFYVTCCVQR